MSPALEVRNLVKRYGSSVAVEDVSLSVGDGELVCLVGPSGCGKTTVLRCIAGLLAPESGRIVIGGRVAFSSSPRVSVRAEARNVGLVFQDYALWPHMNVREHVRFPMESRATPRREREARVSELVDLVQLSAYGNRRPGELSGGQQQRVALARALAGAPALLLMDEPMSNLDARLRQQMRSELTRLLRRSGVATLYVTHDQAEAMSIADRILVLRAGRVIQQGTPADVYERPADLELADFLGIGPLIAAAPGAAGVALAAGGLAVRLQGSDAGAVTQLVVPPSAVHPTSQGGDGEVTIAATVESAAYEGGSWLVDARIQATGELIQFRAVRPPVAGESLILYVEASRLLPFTETGRLCACGAERPADSELREVRV